MSDTSHALEFRHVWKKFRKGEIYDSLRDLVPAMAARLLAQKRSEELRVREFWALHDVSFQVRRGEAFGIIGANGAGKSTTLRLLSKILRPNSGSIVTHGRLSALIEVGAGFHPDLTGRENVYLNGAILGMTRREIDRKFDEIVEFAAITDFIDTPVKRYSTGMYARLGFAVAAHVDPEILLVDEVLSVGDMTFQEKCLDRMMRISREGTTVIFVSHNLQAVQMLCTRVLFLKKGTIAKLGTPSEVLTAYLTSPSAASSVVYPTKIRDVQLQDMGGQLRSNYKPGDECRLQFVVEPSKPLQECLMGLIVHRASDGLVVCDYNIPLAKLETPPSASGASTVVDVDLQMNLLRGAYVLSLHIFHLPTSLYLSRADRVVNFFVEETVSWQGVSHLHPVIRRPTVVLREGEE